MKRQQHTTYTIVEPPKAVRQARLDNIALVPASLLANKRKYQTITHNLPNGGVLLCATPNQKRISQILSHVALFFKEKGHIVRILPYSLLV